MVLIIAPPKHCLPPAGKGERRTLAGARSGVLPAIIMARLVGRQLERASASPTLRGNEWGAGNSHHKETRRALVQRGAREEHAAQEGEGQGAGERKWW